MSPLRRAHATLPIDLSDPAVFGDVGAQRRALATRLGLAAGQGDDLSRSVVAHTGAPDKPPAPSTSRDHDNDPVARGVAGAVHSEGVALAAAGQAPTLAGPPAAHCRRAGGGAAAIVIVRPAVALRPSAALTTRMTG
jgi:hypothetical protein